MRNIIIGVIIIVLIIVGVWYFSGKNKGYNTPTNSSQNPSTSSSQTKSNQTGTTQKQSQASTSAVTIQNFAFSPADITVKKGTKVTWTNQDSTAHTVTETDGQNGPGSGTLNQGQTYSFTFDSVGTFHYHCSIHTSMTGMVTVTE